MFWFHWPESLFINFFPCSKNRGLEGIISILFPDAVWICNYISLPPQDKKSDQKLPVATDRNSYDLSYTSYIGPSTYMHSQLGQLFSCLLTLWRQSWTFHELWKSKLTGNFSLNHPKDQAKNDPAVKSSMCFHFHPATLCRGCHNSRGHNVLKDAFT